MSERPSSAMSDGKTHEEIAEAVRGLEQERRQAARKLMQDFDNGYYRPNLNEMREACGRLGHKWRFTHLGPLRKALEVLALVKAIGADMADDSPERNYVFSLKRMAEAVVAKLARDEKASKLEQ